MSDMKSTVNKKGKTVLKISNISKQFIEDCNTLTRDDTVMDVGCCYGVATLPILKNSTCHIVCLDLAKEHLNVLLESVPQDELERITTVAGHFPQVMNVTDNSLSAIHGAHLLQFLSGPDLVLALKKCHAALKVGGKVYFSTTSPYHPLLKDFLPVYQQKIKQGEAWPGDINNFLDYIPKDNPMQQTCDNNLHLLTKEVLSSELIKAGFTILESYYYDLQNPDAIAADNKEMLGIIAVKE